MLIDLLLFPLFLSVVYVIGAGALRISGDVYPTWFTLTAGLFSIAFIAVIVNFFSGLASPVFYGVVAVPFIVGAVTFRRPNTADFFEFIILAIIFTPLASAMTPGPDAGLYHLPHQLWIRDEKIVFGLANFYSRYGFSSLMEYLSAPLWVGEYFKLVSYAMAAFPLIFMLFLLHSLKLANVQPIAAGLLTASLLIYSHYFDFVFTSTDTPTGILFAIAFLCGLELLLDTVPVSRDKLVILFLCAVFCYMLKVSAALIFLWVLFVLFSLWRARRVVWKDVLLGAIFPAIVVLVWLVHGVIISGCLFYPVVQSCLNVSWNAADNAIQNTIGITYFARHPATDDMTNWFTVWWLPNNKLFIASVVMNIVLVAALYRYFCAATLGLRRDIIIPGLLFVLLALAVWFVKAPTPRFGIGIFAILPVMIALSLFGLRSVREEELLSLRNKLLNAIHVARWPDKWRRMVEPHIVGYVMVLALAVKFGVYGLPVKYITKPFHAFDMLTVPASKNAVPDKNFGMHAGPDCECWLLKYCAPDERPHMEEYDGYKYFRK